MMKARCVGRMLHYHGQSLKRPSASVSPLSAHPIQPKQLLVACFRLRITTPSALHPKKGPSSLPSHLPLPRPTFPSSRLTANSFFLPLCRRVSQILFRRLVSHLSVLLEGLLQLLLCEVPRQVSDEEVALFRCSRVVFEAVRRRLQPWHTRGTKKEQ